MVVVDFADSECEASAKSSYCVVHGVREQQYLHISYI